MWVTLELGGGRVDESNADVLQELLFDLRLPPRLRPEILRLLLVFGF